MINKIIDFFKQFDHSTSNQKNENEFPEIELERGEVQNIVFPEQLDEKLNYRIVNWFVNTGTELLSGDKLCEISNEKNESMIFESYLKGRLQFKYPENQILKKNSTIAKIGSLK